MNQEQADHLRRMAGITTIVENYTSFDDQLHPEDSPELEQQEALEQYSAVKHESMQAIQQVVEQIAQKHGWKPIDVIKLASDELIGFYEMDANAQ